MNKPSSWAKLEKILLGRTLHVHALSPLNPPSILLDSHSQDDTLSSSQLDQIAIALYNFLSIRLTNTMQAVDDRNRNDTASMPSGTIRRLKKGFIRAVRASFVELPDSQTDESKPTPWSLEIEIQPPESSTNPLSSLKVRSKSNTQKAHILFLSNANFATSTHYPILLWKAPPSAVYTEDIGSQQQQQSQLDGQKDAMLSKMNAASTESTVSVTSRMLMAHALDFISRFFDCRISQEAPLCSIRGLNLEKMSEAILCFHRSRNEENGESLPSSFGHFGVDLGFALPTQLLCDIAQSESKIEDGPAPHLNLISLTAPATAVKALMTGTRQGMPVLPGIQQYLALHTSLQLSRLTLVRAGVENIFIGVPTATTLISSAGQISGEVRIKIGTHAKGQMNKSAQLSTQEIDSLERERIGVILKQLILLSEEDNW